jgi:hypothetical protein
MGIAGDPYVPPGVGSAVQKQIDDMKAFMSKDVTELAAGLKESAFEYDAIAVRGRFIAVPRAPANRMMNSAIMACLFSLNDPRIDKILYGVRAQTNFVTPEGEVSLQPIIPCLGTTGDLPKESALGAQPKDPPRHILIEDDPCVFIEKSGQMVAVMTAAGAVSAVGVICNWRTKTSPAAHVVRLYNGVEVEVEEILLRKIDSMEEFAKLCSAPKQH